MLNSILSHQIVLKVSGNLLSAAALCHRKDERKWVRWLQRLLMVVLAVVIYYVDDHLVNPHNASTAIQPFLCLTANFVYLFLIRRMTLRESLLCGAWANMLMEMGCQIFFIFERITPRVGVSDVDALIKLAGMAVTVAVMYCLIRFFLGKVLRNDGKYPTGAQYLLFAGMVLSVFLVMTNYQFIFWLLGFEPTNMSPMIEAFRLVAGFMCIAVLMLQNMLEKKRQASQELEIIRQMFRRQEEQYKLSKENIELINRKCHDLKHQMAALRTIRDREEIDRQVTEMENAVMIYDCAVRTGNPVLDVVLTEKSLYCEAHQINMTCLVDGKLLEFVDRVDLYTLFGNALDNAIESVMQQSDKQKRIIQVAAYEEQGMLLIRIRNYCENVPALVDGLPVTSKEDAQYHGFGLKSIRYTAEKYGGGISIQTGSNFFSLQILMPIAK